MLMACPDYLSNLYTGKEEELSEATLYSFQQVQALPVTANHINIVTRNDPTLLKVLQYTMSGWPNTPDQQLMMPYVNMYYL